MTKPFYITTSIAYVNAAPHIGFALECVQADALARYHKQQGREVFFLTGTDEHGVKIFQTAREQGKTPQELTDENAAKFRNLKGLLHLDYDRFLRTTEEAHKRGARKLWSEIAAAGDLYKDKYSGYYCVGCEAYVTEKDLSEGKCPIHRQEPIFLEEENYYFRLSKYGPRLARLIADGELLILPVERKNEILALIESGLKDVSFSRPRSVLPWGVAVPEDEEQVMYVWCDALANYITALGYGADGADFRRFWPADVHLIGKDILRFHAAIWPAMLLSAGEALPRAIYVHGFVTAEGQKMSKSIGNVVDPAQYVAEFGPDALRYYLLREIPTTADGDFSRQRFIDLYNDELANAFGNLVSRVVGMTQKYCQGAVPAADLPEAVWAEIREREKEYHFGFAHFDLRAALMATLNLVNFANKYVETEKPWLLAKNGEREKLVAVMRALLEIVYRLAWLYQPFLPAKAAEVAALFTGGLLSSCQADNKELLTAGEKIAAPTAPLFPRIEVSSSI